MLEPRVGELLARLGVVTAKSVLELNVWFFIELQANLMVFHFALPSMVSTIWVFCRARPVPKRRHLVT